MAPKTGDVTISALPLGYGYVLGRVLSDTEQPRWQFEALERDLQTAKQRAVHMARDAAAKAWYCRDTATFDELGTT